MNWKKSILFLLLAAVTVTFASAQDQKALTNKDILDMVKKGLSESVIVKVIQASDTNFDTSPDAMTQIQSSGATLKVMDAMLKAGAGKRKTAAAATAAGADKPALPAPADANAGKYLLKEGTEVSLKFAADVSSRYATAGDKVALTLVNDVRVGDVVVVKQGAKAIVVVTNAKRAGMLPGSSGELSLHIEQMTSGANRIRLRGSNGSVLAGITKIRHSNMDVDEGTPLTAYVDEDVWLPPAN
jgi:hypothetical protein